VVTPATRRTPPQCLDPRAKVSNRMNHILADMEAKAAGWMAVLLARCDGTATGHDHHAFLREQEAIPATVTPRDFARLLGQLASGAFIVIPGFEVPEIRGVEA